VIIFICSCSRARALPSCPRRAVDMAPEKTIFAKAPKSRWTCFHKKPGKQGVSEKHRVSMSTPFIARMNCLIPALCVGIPAFRKRSASRTVIDAERSDISLPFFAGERELRKWKSDKNDGEMFSQKTSQNAGFCHRHFSRTLPSRATASKIATEICEATFSGKPS
jgi:hypothetical protein